MAYELRIKGAAQRALRNLAPTDYERIAAVIDRLVEEPRPPGTKRLRSRAPAWRIRVGDFRVIYAIFEVEQLVIIGRVERRSERTYEDIDNLFS